MNYDEFKDLCCKPYVEELNYRYIERNKKKHEERYCIHKEIKNIYLESTLEAKHLMRTWLIIHKIYIQDETNYVCN